MRASRRTERCFMADIFALSYTLSTTEAPLSLSQMAEYTTQSLQQQYQFISLALRCMPKDYVLPKSHSRYAHRTQLAACRRIQASERNTHLPLPICLNCLKSSMLSSMASSLVEASILGAAPAPLAWLST